MRKDAALNGNEEAMQEIAAALAPWKLKVLDQEGIASAVPFDPMQPVLSQVDGSVVEHWHVLASDVQGTDAAVDDEG